MISLILVIHISATMVRSSTKIIDVNEICYTLCIIKTLLLFIVKEVKDFLHLYFINGTLSDKKPLSKLEFNSNSSTIYSLYRGVEMPIISYYINKDL